MNFENVKDEVNLWLKDYFNLKGTYNRKLYEAMYYSIDVGGKRIRPLLLILTYTMYKEDYKNILPVACALEMIHTYSLIHDDLPCMDNDDLRRGNPTNHKVFGEGVAVLAGDGLLNEAMNLMFNYCSKNKNAIDACRVISEAAGADGMIGGQIVDILNENKKISKDELIYMDNKKTGALIKGAILAGGLLGGAQDTEIEKLSLFGEKLGLAFQVKDDILDITGDSQVLGKNTLSDIENNKSTLVNYWGLENSKKQCDVITNECINILSQINENTDSLKEVTKFLLKRNF